MLSSMSNSCSVDGAWAGTPEAMIDRSQKLRWGGARKKLAMGTAHASALYIPL